MGRQSISRSSHSSLARRRRRARKSLTPAAHDGPAIDMRHFSRAIVQLSAARCLAWSFNGRNSSSPGNVIVFVIELRGSSSMCTLSSVVDGLWEHFLCRCFPADDKSTLMMTKSQTHYVSPCCKGHAIGKKWEIRPLKILSPEDFILKLGARD